MSLLTRGFAAIAIVAAATGALAHPASAAQSSSAQLAVFLPDVVLAPDSSGKEQNVIIGSTAPVTATDLKIVVDSSGLAGVATVTVKGTQQECTPSGAVLTCVFDEVMIDRFSSSLPALLVKPLAGVPSGASGTWTATVSADGLAAVSSQAKVEIAQGIDLSVPNNEIDVTSTPGGAISHTPEIDNVGEVAADGAVAVFFGDYAFITTKQYSNCTFDEGQLRSCTFDEQLAAETGYAANEPIPFKLREDTFAPGSELLEYIWMTKAEFAAFSKELAGRGGADFLGQPGTGGKLSLVVRPQAAVGAAQTDLDPSNNNAHLHAIVEGDNDADYAAVGGSGSGTAGQIVTLNLGVKNLGPATQDNGRVLGFATVDITLPPGSSLTEMPKECVAMSSIGGEGQPDPNRGNLAARFIRCENPDTLFIVGTQVTFAVKLRIDQATADATGSVAVLTDGCDGCREDKNPANNTASVVLNSSSLPTTGVRTGLIAGTGALLAFAGIAVFVLSRRRRATPNT